MHGRLKVKDSAEKAAEKAREREKKRKKYLGGINILFEKRKKQEYNNESLHVCGLLLQANPDALTLWNIRRETLLALRDEYQNKGEVPLISDEDKKKDEAFSGCVLKDNVEPPVPRLPPTWHELLLAELSVVSACLERNHKSYGAWHHRVWVMTLLCEGIEQDKKNAHWEKELKLCDLFLKLDERNFHCWDYRRFIVKASSTPYEKELRYSLELINRNFSNFSAWHYRSKLLPLVHKVTEEDAVHPVPTPIFEKELRRVVEAIFTDPSDQSPWFFLRWLLQRPKVSPKLVMCGVTRVDAQEYVAVCCYSSIVSVDQLPQLLVEGAMGHHYPASLSWFNYVGNSNNKVWWSTFSHDGDQHHFKFVSNNSSDDTIEVSAATSDGLEASISKVVLTDVLDIKLSEASLSTLKELLQNCTELNEVDPDKKWVLLTLVELLWAVNSEIDRCKAQEILEQLSKIDPLRTGYYMDTKSKLIMEQKVKDYLRSGSVASFKAAESGVCKLSYMEYLCCAAHINLSHNNIKDITPLCHCVQCSELVLDDNPLASLEPIKMLPNLRQLSLIGCKIETAEFLLPLVNVKSLERLSLLDNNFGEENIERVKEIFKNLQHLEI